MSGGVPLSHAVPSALKGLTSGFGMGPGVSPSLWPPKHYGNVIPGAATHSEPTARRDRPHLGNRTVDAKQYQSVVAKQPCSWQNHWHTRGLSVPVLSY